MLKIDPNRKKINKEIILVFSKRIPIILKRTNSLQIEYGVWMKHHANILTHQKKSFKLRNSKSFSKTHGFNQRDTLVACIRADGARLAPMIIETRNAYLNKKDSSKSREKIGGMSEDFMIFWLETRANCLPHMHNYTRILRLLIISKYYYDATGESVRGNFIKNGLALWKKGCTEKIESINNNLYPRGQDNQAHIENQNG
ncbi:hypothetical protein M0813_13273 [Anaeramoeba flamelloides]|uniref:Uncharacterized protein n=1 Tax=Anaeramoeba flamelloides TaxID=1746091 RepID=A0ABQ8ZAZ0_9EUKA|nr:hypothetical protein M0813_13273 [Anaeramoeba flamelloides]